MAVPGQAWETPLTKASPWEALRVSAAGDHLVPRGADSDRYRSRRCAGGLPRALASRRAHSRRQFSTTARSSNPHDSSLVRAGCQELIDGSFGIDRPGAVIGAAATGGTQALIAARQRRLDRQVAARAILGDLFRTEGLLLGVLDHGQWPLTASGLWKPGANFGVRLPQR
jgi:hypothetical protein